LMSNGGVRYNETVKCGKYVISQLVARQNRIKEEKGGRKWPDRVLEYKKKDSRKKEKS